SWRSLGECLLRETQAVRAVLKCCIMFASGTLQVVRFCEASLDAKCQNSKRPDRESGCFCSAAKILLLHLLLCNQLLIRHRLCLAHPANEKSRMSGFCRVL